MFFSHYQPHAIFKRHTNQGQHILSCKMLCISKQPVSYFSSHMDKSPQHVMLTERDQFCAFDYLGYWRSSQHDSHYSQGSIGENDHPTSSSKLLTIKSSFLKHLSVMNWYSACVWIIHKDKHMLLLNSLRDAEPRLRSQSFITSSICWLK